MVEISIDGGNVIFNVKGLHKILAFKSRLEIPREHIVTVRHDPTISTFYKGIRSPGTHIPGLIAAGTFFKDGKRVFWDVFRAKNAVVVDLTGEKYNQLIVEVEDPAGIVALLT